VFTTFRTHARLPPDPILRDHPIWVSSDVCRPMPSPLKPHKARNTHPPQVGNGVWIRQGEAQSGQVQKEEIPSPIRLPLCDDCCNMTPYPQFFPQTVQIKLSILIIFLRLFLHPFNPRALVTGQAAPALHGSEKSSLWKGSL